MTYPYHNIDELVGMIEEPNRRCCERFLEDNSELLKRARGSKHNHQAWMGGYMSHVTDCMNIAIALYDPLNERRLLEFTISDALLVLFLHDIEKPWKYEREDENYTYVLRAEMRDRTYVKKFADAKIKEYEFELTNEHRNALKYAEGEIDDYTPGERKMGRLAAFVHMCDVWSARGWHDFPKQRNSW